MVLLGDALRKGLRIAQGKRRKAWGALVQSQNHMWEKEPYRGSGLAPPSCLNVQYPHESDASFTLVHAPNTEMEG